MSLFAGRGFLFSLTLFLSAALLFSVQPLLGKLMLPLVGGSPSGWLTALAFFQLALLAGYLLAHGFSRLSARNQMIATAALLLAGAIMLPPHFSSTHDIEVSSVGGVLWLLFRTIFLPYVALATVSSGLQRLYAARHCHTGASDPYFLYAASNAGSFVGLLSYPLLVEPFLPLSTQSWLWAVDYALLVLLIITLTAPKSEPISPQQPSPISTPSLSWRRRLHWVILAFIPSSLSMGLTALVTADLGSFPLLWVIPLALYLLTFVIAFARKRKLQAQHLAMVQLAMTGIMIFLYGSENGYSVMHLYKAIPPLLAFFITALWCHIKLAELRPDETKLTEFYLWLALGGALGGSFNAFLAPLIFAYPIEFMLTLLATCFLHPFFASRLDRAAGLVGGIVSLGIVYFFAIHQSFQTSQHFLLAGQFIVLPLCLLLASRYVPAMGMTGLAIVFLGTSPLNIHAPLDVQRDFFGHIKIADYPSPNGYKWRFFLHGSTIHGLQRVHPSITTDVNTYYTPIHNLTNTIQPQKIGVVGLGAGVLLCMQAPERQFTVYEISPLVVTVAKKWFSYISTCGEPQWRIGDGRLELAKDHDARYDLLILDAFSSDSVPIHLLTKEAVALYAARLSSRGILAFNISNRYYDLRGPLAALANSINYQSLFLHDQLHNIDIGRAASRWVIMAPQTMDLSALQTAGWSKLDTPDAHVWSDDFANVTAALYIFTSPKKKSDGEHDTP